MSPGRMSPLCVVISIFVVVLSLGGCSALCSSRSAVLPTCRSRLRLDHLRQDAQRRFLAEQVVFHQCIMGIVTTSPIRPKCQHWPHRTPPITATSVPTLASRS